MLGAEESLLQQSNGGEKREKREHKHRSKCHSRKSSKAKERKHRSKDRKKSRSGPKETALMVQSHLMAQKASMEQTLKQLQHDTSSTAAAAARVSSSFPPSAHGGASLPPFGANAGAGVRPGVGMAGAHVKQVQMVPTELDPRFLIAEREKKIAARIARRTEELAKLPQLPENLFVQATIEAKQLQLLPFQRKVRQQIADCMREATAFHAAQDPSSFRRNRKAVNRESKVSERIEKQQRLHEEQRRRAKHKEFLAVVLNHAKDFKDYHANRIQNQKKLMRAIVNHHITKVNKAKKQKEKEARERLLALKSNDEEAYRRHVDKAKNQRLKHLLDQTDEYLAKLGKLVQKQRRSGPAPSSSTSATADASAALALDQLASSLVATSSEPSTDAADAAAAAAATIFTQGSDAESGGESAAVVAPIVSVSASTSSSGPELQAHDDDDDQREYYEIAHSVQEDISVQPPSMIGGSLKPYQLKGLEWLVSLYNNNLNGILADEMGLGKTIQSIALITYLMDFKNNNGPFLVVVPLSTLNNWRLEMDRWCPTVIKIVYKGTAGQRKRIYIDEISTGTFNVVLTTYDYVLRDKSLLSKVTWNYIIIDEGHRMKNRNCKLSTTLSSKYSSHHRLLLTGTPLQNNLPELWALLNFLLPHIFNSADNFEQWFNAPFSAAAVASSSDGVELNEEEKLLVINRLHKVLRPFLLRRLKTDVESQLPDKVEKVLRCEFSAFQRHLYDQMTQRGSISSEDGGMRGLMNTLMQLRKICNHPYLFRHEYYINEDMIRASGKFDLLDQMLRKLSTSGHRVLIFSQMTQLMDILGDFFDFRGYKFLRLDGSTKPDERGVLVDKFNAPGSEYFIFVLSTRAGGLGLNLQTADTVILFDSDWNPHADLQAQDRAHRIGQQREVRVFRLVTAGSVEETILDRALQKLDIDAQVIQAGMYNSRSKAGDRRAMLETLLRGQSEKEETCDDDLPTEEEINRMIARSEDEFDMFERLDQEMYQQRLTAWRQQGNRGPPPPRLMQLAELPKWVVAAQPVRGNDLEKYGRGTRERKDAVYSDNLTDLQFMKMIEAEANSTDKPAAPGARKRIAQHQKEAAEEEEELLRLDPDEEADGGLDNAQQDLARSAALKIRVTMKSGVPSSSSSSSQSAARPPKTSRKRGRPKKNGPDALAESASAPKRARVNESPMILLLSLVMENCDSDGRPRSEIFMKLPTRREYPDYYKVIPNPMDLSTVKKKLSQGRYINYESFCKDMKLIFTNAKFFNCEDSQIWHDADFLLGLFDEKSSSILPLDEEED